MISPQDSLWFSILILLEVIQQFLIFNNGLKPGIRINKKMSRNWVEGKRNVVLT